MATTKTTEVVDLTNPFGSIQAFEAAQRIGQMLSVSVFTPDAFKNKVGDCVIALEMANRMRLPVPMVMQNMYIVYGKPSWSSQFIIGRFNMTGKYTDIQYETNVDTEPDRSKWYCVAKSTVIATGEEIRGAKVTWAMAEAEGWTKKNGSKWNTIPEQMLRYRAASFLISTHAPQIKLGIALQEDIEDGMSQNTIDIPTEEVTEQPVAALEQTTAQPAAEQTATAAQIKEAKDNLFAGTTL